jgi:glucose/arabinose dehydrogenase
MKMKLLIFIFILSINYPVTGSAALRSLFLDSVQLPKGFKIELFADKLPNARALAISDKGTVFLTAHRSGKIYALQDNNGDGKADKIYIIAENLDMPNGIVLHKGALFVAEIGRILRFDNIEAHLNTPPPPVVIYNKLPTDSYHGWRYLGLGPDQKLYISIGVPCNVCKENNSLFGTINRMNPDGSQFETVAVGVRNSMGFAWHPQTQELWFTDNGRDWLGDKMPDDELNRVTELGQDFGFPYCHAGIIDPVFGKGHKCDEFTAPIAKLGAHVSPLGMRFYTGSQFPATYKNQLFIAEHGSWNTSHPVGYRIISVHLKNSQVEDIKVFATGWLHDDAAWGRPVDLSVMPDGALLVSDDLAGAIYRISYSGGR